MSSNPSGNEAISSDTIERAVAQGVLTLQQVEMLRYLEKARASATVTEPADEEEFRFINGFGDIFVTIGVALFLGALSYFASNLVGSVGAGCTVSLTSWLLA